MGMIRQIKPDLVVIDSNLPEAEMNELILWLKKSDQQIHSLALVETTRQLKKAATAGADTILRSYTLPANLDSVIGKLQSTENTNYS